MKSSKKVKKEPSTNVIDIPPTKVKKIDDLLKRLNHTIPTDGTVYIFWKDNQNESNKFGDIFGVASIERFYEIIKGSIYFEYKETIKDKSFKLIVIDISSYNKKFELSLSDVKKRKMLAERGIIYLKHHDINFLYNEILNIK